MHFAEGRKMFINAIQKLVIVAEQSVRRLVQDAVDDIRRLPDVLHIGGDYL